VGRVEAAPAAGGEAWSQTGGWEGRKTQGLGGQCTAGPLPCIDMPEVVPHCMQLQNVILKMCPFLGDQALNSTRKHSACTNGVRTKDSGFWTGGNSTIPKNKSFFVVDSSVIPVTPFIKNLRQENFTIRAFQSHP
jgi:hypothetical protein